MGTEVSVPVSFGPFCLDAEARLLTRDGQPVALTPKAFDALVFFAQNRGRLISKEELMKALWPDSFVCESNLPQTVFVLRKALGQLGEQYIVTVPGRGYRFTAELEADRPAAPDPQTLDVKTHNLWVSYWPWLVGFVVVLVGVVGARWYRGRETTRGRVLLAVLPFQNFTGEKSEEYFVDGFTEDMITKLGSLDSKKLGVIGRTSVMRYKNTGESINAIANDLGVQYVLEGSVQRDGNIVRITAQLIQAKDQTHVWAHHYDRALGEVLEVQDEIADQIAQQIQLTLKVSPRRPNTLSPEKVEAYDLYLRGRYFWNQRTPESIEQAIAEFQAAIERDPGYARAYAGLADSYALMSTYGYMSPSEGMPKARTAALKALQIDSSLAEAHTSLALIEEIYDWNWDGAEKEFKQAIELDPNYATAHHWYAELLACRGRFNEALAESERARQLDPLSLAITADNGAIYLFSRRYDKAIERFRSVLSIDPSFARAHLIIEAYVEAGRLDDAQKFVSQWHPRIWQRAWECYVDAALGDTPKAEAALQDMERRSRAEKDSDPTPYVVAYLGLNRKEDTLRAMDQEITEHASAPMTFKVDPLYDSLRNDPRFQELLRKVHLE